MGTAPTSWYDEQLHKWDSVAHTWHEGDPPAVPSAEDLRVFTDAAVAASRRLQGRLVLLGATVALRRALLTHPDLPDARLITVDFSDEMIRITTDFLALDTDLSREWRVTADWRDLAEVVDGPVNAIMGDKSFDNLAFRDWRAVLDGCATVLQSSGLLVLHVGLVDPTYVGFDAERCLDGWATKVECGTRTLGEAAAGLWEDLLTASAYVGDPAQHELSVNKFGPELDALARRYESWTLHAALLAEFERLFGSSNSARWTAFDLDDLYEQAKPWFSPGRVTISRDYEAAPQQPVVELVRNPETQVLDAE